jgi:hypothetical protein
VRDEAALIPLNEAKTVYNDLITSTDATYD